MIAGAELLPVITPTSTNPANEVARKRFVIRLNDQMGENQAIDVLLHEWGHALAWNHLLDRLAKSADTSPEEFEQASHDEAWGCAYARVWRAYLAAG
jgi:hypothetical protein